MNCRVCRTRTLFYSRFRDLQYIICEYRKDHIQRKKVNNWIGLFAHFSSHHSFSFLTCSSSAGVKSFLMLNVFLISSGVLPLIMLATVLQVTSSSPPMSR